MNRILTLLLTFTIVLLPGLIYGQTWTWPGDLGEHMRLHGVDPTGKSHGELRAMHDQIHNITQQGTPNSDDYKLLSQRQVCPPGGCPPARSGFGIGGGTYIGPTTQQPYSPPPIVRNRPCNFWPGGLARLRAPAGSGIIYYGSAVCVGYGRVPGEWIFLTAAHCLEGSQTVQLNIRGQWVTCDVLYVDKLAPVVRGVRQGDGPDRAILAVKLNPTVELRFRTVSYPRKAGQVAICGYPQLKTVTVCGNCTDSGRLIRVSLEAPSQSGHSGGGVFNSNSELIGIWTSGRGGIGYAEPISAYIECFRSLGWLPGNWPPIAEADPPDKPPLTEPEPTEDTEAVNKAVWERLHSFNLRIKQMEFKIAGLSDCKDGKDGKDGDTGPEGPVGPAGVGITDAVIKDGDLILFLSNNTEVNAGQLPVGSCDITDEELVSRVWKKLPPFYPAWIDKEGNVTDEIKGGVHLGQTMPLRLTVIQKIVDEAVERATARSE